MFVLKEQQLIILDGINKFMIAKLTKIVFQQNFIKKSKFDIDFEISIVIESHLVYSSTSFFNSYLYPIEFSLNSNVILNLK